MSALDIHSEINSKQLRLLFQSLPTALLLGLGIALLLSFVQIDAIPGLHVGLWLGCLTLVSSARFVLSLSFKKNFDDSKPMIKKYEQLFYIGVLASGLTWGASGILLFPAEAVEHQFLLAFALAGVSTGSVSSLSPNLKHAISFILLTLSPLMFNLMSDLKGISVVEGIMCLLFMALLIQMSRSMHNTIEAMLTVKAGLVTDVAGLSTAIETARRQKKIFELVLENIPARVFWKDKNLRYLGANQHFLDETRLPKGTSIVGLSDSEMPWAAKYEAFLENERNIINNREAKLHYIEHAKSLSGQMRWLEISKVPILNDDNEVEGLLGVFQDITKRKQSEDMLKLAASAFETHEAVLITDTKGNILSVNKAFTEITGYSHDDVVGKKPSVISSGKHDINFYQNMWSTLLKDGRWKGELINRRKSGEEFSEQLTITAVRNESEQVTNYVGVFSDVSETKELERQLRQSQKMDALGTLVSGISHEFNNMLVGISGNIFLSQGHVAKDSPAYEMLQIAEDISFKAADMIKQLLAFARKEGDNQILKPLNISEWLAEGLKLSQASIPADTQLIFHQPEKDLTINADTTQLQQVLINLINNARDAAEEREKPVIEIELSSGDADIAFRQCHQEFKAFQFVKLSVKDNGSGIAKDKLEKIFEPFFTTKEVGKGTGLGMPVIQSIVRTHMGCIEVESTEGEGTAIHIYFPRVIAEQQNGSTAKAVSSQQGHGETILVADDEADVLMVTCELLKDLGYHTVEASSGAEAVKLFEASPEKFDLILLDVIMPELSGAAAALKIRSIRPEIPLAFYTGYSHDEMLKEIQALDNYQLIHKPFRIAEVSQMINSMLKAS